MIDILIFGSLPSGLGGMEKVFTKLSTLFNQNSHFHVKFYMYALNNDNNLKWLEADLDYKLYYPESRLRFIQKIQIKKNFLKYLEKQPCSLIIVYDPLSIHLAREVLNQTKLNIPIFSWLHFSLSEYKLKYQKYVLSADKHLALCNSIKEQLITHNVKNTDIYTIYNPVSLKYESIPSPVNETNKFLYIGRVQYEGQKNIQELFNALSKMDKLFTLDIIGDGDIKEKEKLINLAKSLDIDKNIIWHGWQSNPWQYIIDNIRSITALVLSSQYEGYPMVLCEALSYGVFCISSNCETGPCEIINQQNGLLYPPGNVQKLTLCLENAHNLISTHSSEQIKNSISYLYDDNYYCRIKDILLSTVKK